MAINVLQNDSKPGENGLAAEITHNGRKQKN